MKKGILFLFIFFLLQLQTSIAQTGVQVSYFMPVNDMRYIFKPTAGIEVTMGSIFPDEDGRFMVFGSMGIMKFSPTADTFRSVAYTNDPDRSYIIPSVQVINSFVVLPISLSGEFKILNSEFSPTAGFDATFYAIIYDSYSHVPGLIQSNSVGQALWQTGFTPKLGLTYTYDMDWLLSASIGKSFGWKGTADPLTFTKTSIRVARIF